MYNSISLRRVKNGYILEFPHSSLIFASSVNRSPDGDNIEVYGTLGEVFDRIEEYYSDEVIEENFPIEEAYVPSFLREQAE
jgi:hypothetical protein